MVCVCVCVVVEFYWCLFVYLFGFVLGFVVVVVVIFPIYTKPICFQNDESTQRLHLYHDINLRNRQTNVNIVCAILFVLLSFLLGEAIF